MCLSLDVTIELLKFFRDWRCRLYPYVGRTSDNAWEAAYAWAESTSIGVRNAVQFKIEKCRKGLVTISGFERFKKCVEAMPDDMTLVHLAMADNKQIYLIKLHADREPIVMPLAHSSQAMELMEKFTFLLQEDEKIAKFPGPLTPEEFWKKRKIVDARMMTFVDEVQKNFFDVSASLLMPTDRLGPVAKETAVKIQKLSKQGIRLGEAKEMVYLSEHMDVKSWEKLGLRFCEMRNKDSGFLDILPGLHRSCLEAMKKDRKTGKPKPSKKYTYLVICPVGYSFSILSILYLAATLSVLLGASSYLRRLPVRCTSSINPCDVQPTRSHEKSRKEGTSSVYRVSIFLCFLSDPSPNRCSKCLLCAGSRE